MSSIKKRISIVVSCYESESTILEMYDNLNDVLSPLIHYNFELIFVDDGSNDNTLALLKSLLTKQTDHTIKLIDLGKNQGQVSSVLAGLSQASGEATIISSSDLQDPLELIADFISAWEDGSDLVFGQRQKRQDGIIRKLGAYIWHNLILKKLNDKLPKGGADYGLISGHIIEALIENTSKYRFLQAEVFALAKDVAFIPYKRGKNRNNRKSTWTFSRLVNLMIDISFLEFNLSKGYFLTSLFFAFVNSVVAIVCFFNILPFTAFYLTAISSVFILIVILALILINGIKFLIKNQNSTKAFHIKAIFSNKD